METTKTERNINQFVPVLERGDAIGNHAIAIREFLRSHGHTSEIFASRWGKGMRAECRHYSEFPLCSSPENVVIYHFGVSSPMTPFFLKAPDRKAIIYHNITPERFYKGINDEVYYILKKGRRELSSLANKIDLAMADSEYNRRELVDMGFENTHTVPLLLDFDRYDVPPDESIIRKYGSGTNIIFVGRITPNKKQEDLIRIFSIYRKYINPQSRLFIVGSARQGPEYTGILQKLVGSLAVEDVHFMGAVSQAQLNAYYKSADLFLCMSEHEGFCIPLLESMHFGVPIIAYDSTAVTGTMDSSGILVSKKVLGPIAEMIGVIIKDENIKERIIRGQRERLRRFQRQRVEKELQNCLTQLLN